MIFVILIADLLTWLGQVGLVNKSVLGFSSESCKNFYLNNFIVLDMEIVLFTYNKADEEREVKGRLSWQGHFCYICRFGEAVEKKKGWQRNMLANKERCICVKYTSNTAIEMSVQRKALLGKL